MAEIKVEKLHKAFGDFVAVRESNFTVENGEFFVMLGPSGCGKTTTLRMIGGHEEPSSGEMLLDGQSLLGLPPEKRPTTTVFQHFALFPHKNVLDNVEFGPKMHGVGKEERRRKAQEALEMVGLTEYADRKPAALSGGQQQRVALARVLVMEPKALLLDEPLGDLDRLLRLRMRVELRNLQRQLGLMFIHVTHDQEEALSVADRIVVMHEGRIAQVGDPFTISTRPENEIVARFMGDNNIFRGSVARDGDRVVIDAGRLKVATTAPAGFEPGSETAASIRASGVRVDEEPRSDDGVNQLECEVEFVEYLGDLVKLHLRQDEDVFVAKVPGDEYALLRGREGATVRISWQEADVQLLRP